MIDSQFVSPLTFYNFHFLFYKDCTNFIFIIENNIITDGSRSSLRRLRSQLAEDGCPESQVVLAKELLEERCGNNTSDLM